MRLRHYSATKMIANRLLPWTLGWLLLPSFAFRSSFTINTGGRHQSLPLPTHYHRHHAGKSPPLLHSTTSSAALLEAIQSDPQDETQIATCIEELEAANPQFQSDEAMQQDANNQDFDPLLGLYEVSFVKTQRPKDNPVGGKWTRKTGIAQKILRTRRSFQHLLPVNATGLTTSPAAVAEAVNVISLEALGGLLRLFVILRGDAIPLTFVERTNTTRVFRPLTPMAVTALFDPPRIVIGRNIHLSIGPRTSVLLDCLFCDDKVRLGMGGTSGSRFVFARCPSDDEEANEFRALLQRPLTKKYKPLLCLGGIAAAAAGTCIGGVFRGLVARLLSGTVATTALGLAALIAFSGGGIERGDMGVTMAKEQQQQASQQ